MKKQLLNISQHYSYLLSCKLLTSGYLIFFSSILAGQEKKEQVVEFSGFIKNDFFFDTRQNVAAREGHFLLWPSPENLDSTGKDINAIPSFNFLSIESRLSVKIKGPNFLGAETSGLLEGDFFGQVDPNINLIRLRHAWIKLNWSKIQLLTGQYWNPLFVENCYPQTVSFNTGSPLQSFARNPQIRIGFKSGILSLMMAAVGQRDYPSYGISGASSVYLRNAAIPDLHLRIDIEKGNILGGLGFAYKSIVPRTSSTIDTMVYKVDESISGITAIAYTKITINNLSFKAQARYGENITDVLSPGGFAVKDVDSVSGKQSYTPLCNITFWSELSLKINKFDIGIFGGYFKSMGTKAPVSNPESISVYGLAPTIESLLRISPRGYYTYNKIKCGFELEYTQASYGNRFDENYMPASTIPVSNIRFLTSMYYYF